LGIFTIGEFSFIDKEFFSKYKALTENLKSDLFIQKGAILAIPKIKKSYNQNNFKWIRLYTE